MGLWKIAHKFGSIPITPLHSVAWPSTKMDRSIMQALNSNARFDDILYNDKLESCAITLTAGQQMERRDGKNNQASKAEEKENLRPYSLAP